jgi:hypothetical protein
MQLSFSSWSPVAALWLAVVATPTQAQSSKAQTPAPRYKDLVGENPTAEADIQVVSDVLQAIVAGNPDKVKGLLAPTYKGYGPAAADSATGAQLIRTWQVNYQVQATRKVDFITQTFNVKTGTLRGHWVSVRGEYRFTQGGKPLKLPFQYTARVTNGQLDQDRI